MVTGRNVDAGVGTDGCAIDRSVPFEDIQHLVVLWIMDGRLAIELEDSQGEGGVEMSPDPQVALADGLSFLPPHDTTTTFQCVGHGMSLSRRDRSARPSAI